MKTKSYLNENIKCYYMHLELNRIQMHWLELKLNCILINVNSIQLDYDSLEIKNNQMQIGGEGIESLLMNMTLEKINYKDISQNTTFHTSLC